MAVNPTNDAAPATTGAPAHTASKGSGGRGERRERRDDREKEKSPYTERVVFINRVSKVVKGPRKFHKQLLRQLKKLRSHSSQSHAFREQFLTQFRVKQQRA
jgi:hypothetical protein